MALKRLLIAGEGGQGIQSLAHIVTSAGFEAGLAVTFLPNFGVEQRGGVSLAYLQLSDAEISFPKFQKADIVVLFAGRAIKRIERYLKKDSLIIFDNSLIDQKDLEHLRVAKIAIPATRIAAQKLTPRVFNIIMLGVLAAEMPELKQKKVEKEIEKLFAQKIAKEPQLKHFNLVAFQTGYQLGTDLKKESKWREKIIKK